MQLETETYPGPRIRCRFGIHKWEPWRLNNNDPVQAHSIYLRQWSRCQCCGFYKQKSRMK